MWVFFLLKGARFFNTICAAFFENGRKNWKKLEKSKRFLKIMVRFFKKSSRFWGVFFRGVACLVSIAFGLNIADREYPTMLRNPKH